jgi:arylsulfatase A-like enzyme
MRDDGHANSLLLAYLTQYLEVDVVSKYQDMFPGGPPSLWDGSYFFLEDAIDWIINNSMQTPKPYLAYYHMFPPHIPYRTRGDFYGRFANDGYHPIEKEEHFFTQNVAQPGLDRNRQQYDEYILYADAEFGRLITAMEANGNLEETWIILTSDHGEMFERGIRGHRQPVFHQPVSRVPLMILPPRQTARQDIYAPTSAVDLLPTLLHLSGEPAPDFIEGDVLPPFSTQNRGEGYFIFALDARMNHPSKPLTTGTFMLVKDNYKLTYYVGYDQLPGGEPFFELYDLAEDPEEVRNLYREHPRQASQMADELLQKLEEKNRPYV